LALLGRYNVSSEQSSTPRVILNPQLAR